MGELIQKLRNKIIDLKVENKYLKRRVDQLKAQIKLIENPQNRRNFKHVNTKRVLKTN